MSDPTTGIGFCPQCGAQRHGSLRYCPSCGFDLQPIAEEAKPGDRSQAPAEAAPPGTGMVRRPIVWLGVVTVVALLFATWNFTRPGIEFIPNTLRCDGTTRAWVFRLPANVENLTVEMHKDGANGPVVTSDSASVSQFETYRQADGSFRAETTTYDAWECRQPSGRYAMVMRDSATGQVIATGEFSIVAN